MITTGIGTGAAYINGTVGGAGLTVNFLICLFL